MGKKYLIGALLTVACLDPSLSHAGLTGYINGIFGTNYSIMSSTVGGAKFKGDFGFGGGGLIEFRMYNISVESGFVIFNRKIKQTNSPAYIQPIKGYIIPSIARYYFAKNWAVGGGFYYNVVSTQGCFDNNNDYGFIVDLRFAYSFSEMSKDFERVRLLLDLQYLHGSQTCNLFGAKTLQGIAFWGGLSIKFS